MVTCQSSELGWEVTVELPIDFLSLGRGSVTIPSSLTLSKSRQISGLSRWLSSKIFFKFFHDRKLYGQDLEISFQP